MQTVPVAVGLTLGSIAAVGTRVLNTAIAGSSGGTITLMAAVPVILFLVAVPACYLPVRRTLRRTSLTDVLRAS